MALVLLTISWVSSEVISITPNRILITPKVIFVTLGVSFLFDFSLNPVSVADDAKVKKNRDFTLTYSHHPSQMPMYRAFETCEGKWVTLTSPSLFYIRRLTFLFSGDAKVEIQRLENRNVSCDPKCEGDVRENEKGSRGSTPLYIGIWEGWCEYVRVKSKKLFFLGSNKERLLMNKVHLLRNNLGLWWNNLGY